MLPLSIPQSREEIIKCTDTGNITGFKTTKNGIKRNTVHLRDPSGGTQFRSNEQIEQVRTQHRSRISWFLSSLSSIKGLKHRSDVRKIRHPELGNKRPVIFMKDENPT